MKDNDLESLAYYIFNWVVLCSVITLRQSFFILGMIKMFMLMLGSYETEEFGLSSLFSRKIGVLN